MDKQNWIEQLVQETFDRRDDLSSIEDLSIESLLHKFNLFFFKGNYHPETQMIRFDRNGTYFDVPTNWSVFHLSNLPQKKVMIFSSEGELTTFLSCLAVWTQAQYQYLGLTEENGQCYLILARESELELIKRLNESTPQTLINAA